MVGVDGVGVVGGDHKALRQMSQIVLIREAHSPVDSHQSVVQEGGGSSLFGSASHFLIVQQAVQACVFFFLTLQKSLE